MKIEDLFENWYLKNQNRFKYKLVKEDESDLVVIYGIKNIIDNIKLVVNKRFCEIELEIFNNETLVDLIPIEYIGLESYDKNRGFYDADRVDNIYTYYKRKKDLYINEVFEKSIEFFNERLMSRRYLLIVEMNGSSYAKIASETELLKKKRELKNKGNKANVSIRKLGKDV